MSTLANESILENIYDEVLEELFDTGRISNCSQDDINSELINRNLHLLFKQVELEAMAEKLALDKFYSNNI